MKRRVPPESYDDDALATDAEPESSDMPSLTGPVFEPIEIVKMGVPSGRWRMTVREGVDGQARRVCRHEHRSPREARECPEVAEKLARLYPAANTVVPGAPVLQREISPELRADRGDRGAWDDALGAFLGLYQERCRQGFAVGEQVRFHLVLTAELIKP